jgi:hypothetical protein
MRTLAAIVLGTTLLGGCAAYVTPTVPPAPGVYVAPPVVVGPGPVGWHGWHRHWR